MTARLLVQALSHRSWCSEHGGQPSNERLEFLGDAVLGLVVAEHCFVSYGDMPEGALAKVRAAVVNTSVLAEVSARARPRVRAAARAGRELLGGQGEALDPGQHRRGASSAPSISTEGSSAASKLVLGLLADRITDAAAGPGAEDFKTRLQELVIHEAGELPRYEVRGVGPDHARRYTASRPRRR